MSIVGKQELSSRSQLPRFLSLKKPGNAPTVSSIKKYPFTPTKWDGFLELIDLRQEVLVNTASNGLVELKDFTLGKEIWITTMILLLQVWKIDRNEAMRERLERKREHLMEMGREQWLKGLKLGRVCRRRM